MTLRSIIKIITGIGMTALGVVFSIIFFSAFMTLMLGFVGPLLIFVGLVMIAIAKE